MNLVNNKFSLPLRKLIDESVKLALAFYSSMRAALWLAKIQLWEWLNIRNTALWSLKQKVRSSSKNWKQVTIHIFWSKNTCNYDGYLASLTVLQQMICEVSRETLLNGQKGEKIQ